MDFVCSRPLSDWTLISCLCAIAPVTNMAESTRVSFTGASPIEVVANAPSPMLGLYINWLKKNFEFWHVQASIFREIVICYNFVIACSNPLSTVDLTIIKDFDVICTKNHFGFKLYVCSTYLFQKRLPYFPGS